jgi:hypothetical protein
MQDNTGKCDNYPMCGHKGYPDCLDLNNLLMGMDTGWYISSDGFSTKGTYVSIHEVKLAAEWINHSRGSCGYKMPTCESKDGTKYDTHYKGKTQWVSSYSLKHAVENDVNEYISNGAMIAAALLMNVPYKVRNSGLNLTIKVKLRKDAVTV